MSVNDKMKAIADAIRAHTGGADALTLDAMAEDIAGLEVGGGVFTFTPATAGAVEFEIENPTSLNKILWCALGVIENRNDYSDGAESVFGCTACVEYNSAGNQKVYTAYGTSATSFSLSIKYYNLSINNQITSEANSNCRGGAAIRYENDYKAIVSFCAAESSYGIRVGETYAVCLVYK